MLTPGFNRWGQMLLHLGASKDFIACPEKQNILSHLAKHKGRSIAIVCAIVGVKQTVFWETTDVGPSWQQSFGRSWFRRNA